MTLPVPHAVATEVAVWNAAQVRYDACFYGQRSLTAFTKRRKSASLLGLGSGHLRRRDGVSLHFSSQFHFLSGMRSDGF